LPDIDESVHQTYADDPVLAYGLYGISEDPNSIADFAEQTGVLMPLVPDSEGTLGDLAFPAGVGFPYPKDVIVGKDLRIRSIRNSYNADEMEALIEELLAE